MPNNVGLSVLCLQQSVCLNAGMCLELSPASDADERAFEGGLGLEPVPGIYKGMIVIDGNCLYGTIMSKLGIFVDSCASSSSAQGLSEELGVDVPENLNVVRVDSMITTSSVIVMRTADTDWCIARGGPTILSTIIDMLISTRKLAKKSRNTTLPAGYKLCTTSLFGTTGSPHAVVSSKTCAETAEASAFGRTLNSNQHRLLWCWTRRVAVRVNTRVLGREVNRGGDGGRSALLLVQLVIMSSLSKACKFWRLVKEGRLWVAFSE